MRYVLMLTAMLAASSLLWAADAQPKPGPNDPRPGDVMVEAEAATLTDCATIDSEIASGKKAITIDKDTSKVEITAKLPAGTYLVELYEIIQDTDHDSLYVSIDGGDKVNVFPGHAKLPYTEFTKVDVGKKTPIVVTEERDVALVITAKDTGQQIDKVIFRKQAEKKPKQPKTTDAPKETPAAG